MRIKRFCRKDSFRKLQTANKKKVALQFARPATCGGEHSSVQLGNNIVDDGACRIVAQFGNDL